MGWFTEGQAPSGHALWGFSSTTVASPLNLNLFFPCHGKKEKTKQVAGGVGSEVPGSAAAGGQRGQHGVGLPGLWLRGGARGLESQHLRRGAGCGSKWKEASDQPGLIQEQTKWRKLGRKPSLKLAVLKRF